MESNITSKAALSALAVTLLAVSQATAHDVDNPLVDDVAIEAAGHGIWLAPDSGNDGRILGKLRFGGLTFEMDGEVTLEGGALPEAIATFGIVSAQLYDRDARGERVPYGLVEGIWESSSLLTGTMRGTIFAGPQNVALGEFRGEYRLPREARASKAAQPADEVKSAEPAPLRAQSAARLLKPEDRRHENAARVAQEPPQRSAAGEFRLRAVLLF